MNEDKLKESEKGTEQKEKVVNFKGFRIICNLLFNSNLTLPFIKESQIIPKGTFKKIKINLNKRFLPLYTTFYRFLPRFLPNKIIINNIY